MLRERNHCIDKELSPQETGLTYMHIEIFAPQASVSEFLLGKVLLEKRLQGCYRGSTLYLREIATIEIIYLLSITFDKP